jgi:hypothetical protein
MIFNGDIIRTGVSAARLEASGYAILLDKETTAIIQDDQLSIICGAAVVKTLQGQSIHALLCEVRTGCRCRPARRC